VKKFAVIFILLVSMLVGVNTTYAKEGGQLLIINKESNKLAYYDNGKLVKTFKVATGRKQSYTPEGKFKVVNKIKNRPYYSGNIRGGDPRNPLGDRWLGLNARGTWGTTYAIHGNNNSKSIGTYASAGCIRMFNDEVRWLYDKVKVNTPVVITKSKKSFDSIAKANGYTVLSKIDKVNISKTSPQPTKTAVTISATAKDNQASQYKFSVHDGAKWTTLKSYSSTSKVTWTPSKEGTYKLRVQIKDKKSWKSYDDEKVLTYKIYSKATIKTVKVDKQSPQPVNTNLSITSQSNNNKTNVMKFMVHDGAKWTTLKDFSTTTTIKWRPTKPGTYKIKVQAKHKLSKSSYDSQKEVTYKISDPTTLKSVSTDKKTPQLKDTAVKITAQSNKTKDQEYKFEIKRDGSNWIVVQDYSPTNFYNWKPTSSGTYQIKVKVKHKLSKKLDHEKIIKYAITEPVSIVNMTPKQEEVLTMNLPVPITVIATGGSNLVYKFQILKDSAWVTLQEYSTSNLMEWKTPEIPGEYEIRVLVKDSASNKDYDTSIKRMYIVE